MKIINLQAGCYECQRKAASALDQSTSRFPNNLAIDDWDDHTTTQGHRLLAELRKALVPVLFDPPVNSTDLGFANALTMGRAVNRVYPPHVK
jgi:hypothetical protein